MKQIFLIVFLFVFTVSFTSCATTSSATENEIAGYNLKSKKEQMHNKILHNKNKTLLACP